LLHLPSERGDYRKQKKKVMNLLQKAGLVPVYLANGDPSLAVAIGIKKVKADSYEISGMSKSHFKRSSRSVQFITNI
jgi:hypothetical protein